MTMHWTGERVMQRIALGEDSMTEFKEARFSGATLKGPERAVIAKELAAFGNASGGVLIFSVSDKREVRGMEDAQADALERVVLEVCNDSIDPSLQIQTEMVELPNGARALVVETGQSAFVHMSGGRYYYRQSSAAREIPPQVLHRLFSQRSRSGLVQPDEQSVAGAGPGTFAAALSERFLSSRTDESANSQLSRLGLLREDRAQEMRATVAGILLCTDAPHEYLPSAFIQAVCYRGDTPDGDRQVDAETITGPLDRQIKEAVAFAVRNMRVSARKEPMRIDMPQYSERAIFEAIVNAVIHRDYSIRGSKIRLFVFDERLALYSPGALNNSLNVDNIHERQSTRNETIASALGRIPIDPNIRGAGDRKYFLERRGEGIPIIRQETKALTGQLPSYRLLDGAELRLILPAAPPHLGGVQAEVSVSAAGRPLEGADVLALYPNQSWTEGKADSFGKVHFNFHSALPMSVFCAAAGYHALAAREWNPSAPLSLELKPLASGGSVIFPQSNGLIPGLNGSLNPILDSRDRTCIYARNIAIDQGKPQPVSFKLGQNLHLEDSDGGKQIARIIDIIGKSALLEYESAA
ncbi:MAG: putative DNA binding domain-containing protein [Gammaproteobacteria bacterium]